MARYQDVKGAFVGSPFLVSKNQNWAIPGSAVALIMKRGLIKEGGRQERNDEIDVIDFAGKLTNICVSAETST